MKKHMLVGLLLVFLFIPNNNLFAQSTADLQAQINSLLEQIKLLQAQLNTQGSSDSTSIQTTPASSVTPSSSGCNVIVSNNLYLERRDNETSGDISRLQRFLRDKGFFTYPAITGYFGPSTEKAVQDWQRSQGIVFSGSPETTGYGVVGPKTRISINGDCAIKTTPSLPPPKDPGTNNPPKIVAVSTSMGTILTGKQADFLWSATDPDGDNLSWAIDWGDGNSFVAECPIGSNNPQNSSGWRYSSSHTWTQAGSYLVNASVFDCKGGMDTNKMTINVVNTPGVGNKPPTISGISGPSSLKVGEAGYWTVSANDPEGEPMLYRVIWGDEYAYLGSVSEEKNLNADQTAFFSHIYNAAGLYYPSFTVIDSYGQQASSGLSVDIGSTQAPKISSIASKAASAGEVYVGERAYIIGSGLSGKISAKIGDILVSIQNNTDTNADFLVPSMPAGYHIVRLTNNEGLTSNDYTVNVKPTGVQASVDIKVNGSDNPEAVKFDEEFTVSWTSSDVSGNACGTSGHHVLLADGRVWTELSDLPASGSLNLVARHKNFGYVSPLELTIDCYNNSGTQRPSDSISVNVKNIELLPIPEPPDITASRNSQSPSGEVQVGTVGAELFKVDLNNTGGSSADVNSLEFDLNGTAIKYISNIGLYDGSTRISTISPNNTSSWFYTGIAQTNLSVPANSTKSLTIKGDVASNAFASYTSPCPSCFYWMHANLTDVSISNSSNVVNGLPVYGYQINVPYPPFAETLSEDTSTNFDQIANTLSGIKSLIEGLTNSVNSLNQ